MAALSYVNEAWAEARMDGVDDDCMAMSCLFAAFAELVTTYGEEAAAKYADSLSKRIRMANSRSKSPASSRRNAGQSTHLRVAPGRNSRFSTASMSLAKNGL